MIEFFPLGKDVNIIKPFIEVSPIKFCDISLGAKYLWRDEFKIDYAIYNETLILKESCRDYINAFYYPIGKDVLGALKQIEDYARENHIPLNFCAIDNDTCDALLKRYDKVEINNDRDWSDYIYPIVQFKSYSGKKLSGQRNHVNKFKKNYPNYQLKIIEKEDFEDIKLFLQDYERGRDFSLWTEKAESEKIVDYIENMFSINQMGIILKVENRIIGLSIGERVGDTLIVHVEKALREYDGVYPFIASEFAKTFCDDKVKFINREEDCGDFGLRKSKLQYHPSEIKQKNFVKVKTLISLIKEPLVIETARLTLTEIRETDSRLFFKLYMDDDLNKYWGYEYRDDLNGEIPTPKYFYDFQKRMRETEEEFSFAVRVGGEFAGELVLHNFDYEKGLEIGYRFLREHQRKGYAFEGATALIDYARNVLGAKTIYTRCDKRNIPSYNLITKLGFKIYKESETHYFFKQN